MTRAGKPYWLFWLLLGVLLALFPAFAWQDHTAGFLTDDGTYLLLADYFSPYAIHNQAVAQFIMDQARFPPAFPILIALAGGGSANMPVAHLVTALCFIASAIMLYVWARRVLDSRELAAACLAVYALLPKTLVYTLEIWSEYLYLTLVLAALLLLERSTAAPRRARELLGAAALCVGLAVLTRTIGVALFGALLVFLYSRRVPRKALYLLIAAALPLAWELVKSVNGYGGGYGEDLTGYLSVAGLQRLLLEDLPRNAALLLGSWQRHFGVTPDAAWLARGTALALLALAGLGAARRARHPDVHYAALYLTIVLVWPYPAHNTRFLYPLMPLALVYVFAGLGGVVPAARAAGRHGARDESGSHTAGIDVTPNPDTGAGAPPSARLFEPRRASHWRAVALLGMLLLVYPNALFVVGRFHEIPPGPVPEDYRHTRQWLRGDDLASNVREADRKAAVLRLLSRLGEHFAPRECVYSAHPVLTMLYSARISIIIPANARIDKLWGCRYLVAFNLRTVYEPLYPLDYIDHDRLKLLDLAANRQGQPQAFLFRITPP